ncbi:probable aquaporin NIP-type isoform X2 [Nicotiana tomentosiformis]|uniref:Aquaporin NIP4-3 n=1 Tax=Nicotiana tomentosiformis TaxID=4098 RepID=A0A6L1G3E5_NICTO|nr:probable aquaporin NIP-type isoform X2 [Nicotiana tomentosiformis]XP_016455585.1 PREDICTED: probable aquaporin NIP-type [Nicotiana tabacum]DAC84391.1 TPA_exp: aquaporin NIP4-3 [Nicotiana tomentosiformis]
MAAQIEGIREDEISKLEEGVRADNICASQSNTSIGFCSSPSVVAVAQKLIAEAIGTYFIIFAGCGSVAVNKLYDGSITFPGICVTWGLIVMVMIYSLGHVSGAHFNPAVTIAFTIFRRFSWKLAPLYIIAQLTGSILSSGTLALLLDVTSTSYFGTVPVGSNGQSLAMEIIISFLLMFVVCGVSTDVRAIGELSGLAVGMTITLNVFVAGPISGASMNPARSIGPAIVKQVYKGLWVYIIGPVIGTLAGAFVYNLIRFTNKPLLQLVKSRSFLRS